MVDPFFCGTLRHLPLLEKVLGRRLADGAVASATLSDHAVYAVQDQPDPVIVAEPGATAQGIVVHGLNDTDMARISFYTGGFETKSEPHPVTTEDAEAWQAQVFFETTRGKAPTTRWSLDAWANEWGQLSVAAADEVMGYFGSVKPDQISGSLTAIRNRAWARLAARQRRTDDPRDTGRDVVVHRHHRASVSYFGFEEVDLQHRQHDGSMGPVLKRSSLLQGSAVVVLPYDPVRDTVLLVEQFRAPLFLIDDPEPWIWQPVAGMIDPGETPEQAARRESVEEAQITLTALEPAGGAYSSAGSSTEFLHLFVGLAELTQTIENGGLDTEGEDIRSKILSFDAFMDLVDRHVFKDLPLLSLAHWLARHRERLRA